MSQIFLFLFTAISFYPMSILAQDIEIPDRHFKNALLEHNPIIDTNHDKEIQLEEAEAFKGVLNLQGKRIKNLTGIEFFVHINMLDCQNNKLRLLDLSSNTEIVTLYCQDNRLEQLEVPHTSNLEYVNCSSNLLREIDLEHTGIQHLSAKNNPSLNIIRIPNHADIAYWSIDNGITIFRYFE